MASNTNFRKDVLIGVLIGLNFTQGGVVVDYSVPDLGGVGFQCTGFLEEGLGFQCGCPSPLPNENNDQSLR